MNVKFLNPFVEAAHDVLSAEVGITPARGTVSLQQSALTADEVTVLISLVGQVQGVVLYGMSVEMGLLLVSRMMSQTFEALRQLGAKRSGRVGQCHYRTRQCPFGKSRLCFDHFTSHFDSGQRATNLDV